MLNKINLIKIDKKKIVIVVLIITFFSIGVSFTINGILFKNTQALLIENKNKKFYNNKLIQKSKITEKKLEEFIWKITKLEKNLTNQELKYAFKIFFDLSENPILKFKLNKLLNDLKKEDKNINFSILLKNIKINKNNEEEDNEKKEIKKKIDLPPSKSTTNKIYQYFLNNKKIFKEWLIKRNELFELKIKEKEQIKLINKIFINLINEKKSKVILIKKWLLKIIKNSKESNKKLLIKKKYKKYTHKDADYDEEINKLDIERFWLWTKSKSKFNEWKEKNPDKSLFPTYQEIRMVGNSLHWLGTQNKSLHQWMYYDYNEFLYTTNVKISGIFADISFKNKELNEKSLTEGWGYIYRKNFNYENIKKITEILKNIEIYLKNIDIFSNLKLISKEKLNTLLQKEMSILNLIQNFENLFIKNIEIISNNIKDNPFLKKTYFKQIKTQLKEF